jgi:hypothetical protein
MEASWSHDDVFPLIARAIETLSAQRPGYASHDAIVSQLLSDPQALSCIDAARTGEAADRTRGWLAHNMVAWFSQRVTIGVSPCAAHFDRRKLQGKWAYRVAM